MTLNIILKNSQLPNCYLACYSVSCNTSSCIIGEPIFNYHNVTLYSEVNFRNNPFSSTIVCGEGLKN